MRKIQIGVAKSTIGYKNKHQIRVCVSCPKQLSNILDRDLKAFRYRISFTLVRNHQLQQFFFWMLVVKCSLKAFLKRTLITLE